MNSHEENRSDSDTDTVGVKMSSPSFYPLEVAKVKVFFVFSNNFPSFLSKNGQIIFQIMLWVAVLTKKSRRLPSDSGAAACGFSL
ncbi:MAG: hypothetical protein K2L46_03455 [Paramuribaculum sp.]|nr:hypothetical protein [Paramuribaculum sp.]MDE6323244.1 hypothetical protein [Paramuribaculum sp.]MDE6488314.1 hypothetical protein [Paramuribaculum sp.]